MNGGEGGGGVDGSAAGRQPGQSSGSGVLSRQRILSRFERCEYQDSRWHLGVSKATSETALTNYGLNISTTLNRPISSFEKEMDTSLPSLRKKF